MTRQPQSPSYAGVTDAEFLRAVGLGVRKAETQARLETIANRIEAMRAADTSDGEVERVARTLFKLKHPAGDWSQVTDTQYDLFRLDARKILSAIRNGQSTSDGVQPCEVEGIIDVCRRALGGLSDLEHQRLREALDALRSQSKQVDDGGGK